ncbi:MAG: DUF4270 domain-containing protein [Mariniphaga sp.]|nr:DUF4270 domain-containing protein [Mariniphaga sp.]MDD4424312.1 DUF4270 domain-containing protein [Mariniphaga sp.]
MNSKILFKFQFLALLISSIFLFHGCNEPNDLGMELLPHTDLIEVKSLVERNSISSYTFQEDSIPTSMASKSLLGSFYDPVFGITTINFATQFRLQEFPEFGTNPVADSVKLVLYYRLMYGDTITPQKLKVFELSSSLDVDAAYYQDVKLEELTSNNLLGELDYIPVVKLDSVSADTFYQRISINLDPLLGEKLIDADSLQMINNDVFLEYFKGLFISCEPQTETGGAILTLEASSNERFQGSALVLYYNNQENMQKENPDTLYHPYVITPFSARVNSFEHDYSNTVFYNHLNSESGNDSLIYVQATGGLKSKVIIEGLSSWKDSVSTAVNKAELVFQIDTLASDVKKYPPPNQLYFTYINADGEEKLPADFWFYPGYFGGYLQKSDYTYRFKITQQLQNIIDGEVVNNGFFLTPVNKNNEANRVVLKGSNSHTGIKLVVTYSKFRQ